MIAFLRGRVLEKHPNRIVVDVNGVGYELYVPLSTYYEVGDAGVEIGLHVHTHVREDALQLFGFLTSLEQLLFERLIAISGIGPKLAIAVLSGISTGRSEEHTSELQSQSNLVCRLLLEKINDMLNCHLQHVSHQK